MTHRITKETVSIAILFLLTFTSCQDMSEVIMVVQMTRHGSRAPLNKVIPGETWASDIGLGELTPTGQRQQFQLGKDLRERYQPLFKDSLKNEEFFIRSTRFNRTIMSAVSNFAGFVAKDNHYSAPKLDFDKLDFRVLPPQKNLNIDFNKVNFETALPNSLHPLIVHGNLGGDHLLQAREICTPIQKIQKETTQELKNYMEKSTKLKEYVKEIKVKLGIPETFNEKESDFNTCFKIGDYLRQRQNTVPNAEELISPDDAMYKYVSRCYWLDILQQHLDLRISKVGAAPFMNLIIKWFVSKQDSLKEGGAPSLVKFGYFSGHDSTLNNILTQIKGGVDSKCIKEEVFHNKTIEGCNPGCGVASQLLWELVHKKEGGKFLVRFKYNGEYFDFCDKNNKDSHFECTLDEFISITKTKYTNQGYIKYCGFDSEGNKNDKTRILSDSTTLHLLLGSSFILGLIFVLVILISIRICKTRSVLNKDNVEGSEFTGEQDADYSIMNQSLTSDYSK